MYTGQSVVYTGRGRFLFSSSAPQPTTRYLVLSKMKPIPLSAFIPPVTGTKGRPGAVASNLFDTSGNFRERTASFKRRRIGDERDMDDAFDITRLYPPLVHPPKPLFDVEAIQALMVDASSKAEFIKATSEDPNVDNVTKNFAIANLTFFALLTAVVEKAVIPLANSPPPCLEPPVR